jgi:hypothetical protein
MTLQQQQAAFCNDVVKLIQYINEGGPRVTFGETYRTPEQAELYAKEGKGIKDSLHCKRLAIDINLFDEHGAYLSDTTSYSDAGKYWESLHSLNRWGGRFTRRDANHFERQEA